MNDTHRMLQTIINGQSNFRQEMMGKFDKIDKRFDSLEKKIDQVDEKLTNRMDKIGKQLACLEDDAPTREELDNLAGRVGKVEQKTASVL